MCQGRGAPTTQPRSLPVRRDPRKPFTLPLGGGRGDLLDDAGDRDHARVRPPGRPGGAGGDPTRVRGHEAAQQQAEAQVRAEDPAAGARRVTRGPGTFPGPLPSSCKPVCDRLGQSGGTRLEGGGPVPAKLKLTYALVEQIVELKRDGLCDADEGAAQGGDADGD